ncbi:MAG: hypothetical protein QGH33_12155 [Pirellulaceae bacterium]|nr:hypothetical protein [Pirellulaceae bacterium]
MVIASECQDTAPRRRAGEVRMTQYITGTINARTLAIPHRKYAIVACAGKRTELL